MLKPITEKAFTQMVLDLAALHGWKAVHFRPAMNRRGVFSTPVQGDGIGWPDIFAARGNRLVAAELKIGNNKPTVAQTAWLLALGGAGVEVFVWNFEAWDEIRRILQ